MPAKTEPRSWKLASSSAPALISLSGSLSKYSWQICFATAPSSPHDASSSRRASVSAICALPPNLASICRRPRWAFLSLTTSTVWSASSCPKCRSASFRRFTWTPRRKVTTARSAFVARKTPHASIARPPRRCSHLPDGTRSISTPARRAAAETAQTTRYAGSGTSEPCRAVGGPCSSSCCSRRLKPRPSTWPPESRCQSSRTGSSHSSALRPAQ
mmetsp:Transcript_41893/g.124313  ORF Transcript_41893/g.124313 Transcript_41893/m.124313 type:complete len:215 (-) Transcript_41893:202-846(-)